MGEGRDRPPCLLVLQAAGYGRPRVYRVGQSVPVAIEGREVGRVAVAEIVPTSGARNAESRLGNW